MELGTVNLRSCGRSANRISFIVTRDLVNRGGEPAKIALGLLKLTVLAGRSDTLFSLSLAGGVDSAGGPR